MIKARCSSLPGKLWTKSKSSNARHNENASTFDHVAAQTIDRGLVAETLGLDKVQKPVSCMTNVNALRGRAWDQRRYINVGGMDQVKDSARSTIACEARQIEPIRIAQTTFKHNYLTNAHINTVFEFKCIQISRSVPQQRA